MTDFEALVGLNLIPEIGSVRLNKLLERFTTPGNILQSSPHELQQVMGIGPAIAGHICSIRESEIKKELSAAAALGLSVVSLDHPDYPHHLKHIPDPPLVIYVKGAFSCADACAIAIVGSRRPSLYGGEAAERFGRELSMRKVTVVSGMAKGIDTSAHNGALKAKGRTIAVMGSGFGQIYPPENRRLAERIAENGAVISEFPVGMQPLKQNFPCRNRIISGLSLGVLVVEAARNSGALITAQYALEQNRDVFALPGRIDSLTSCGPHDLIKQGAKLVTCAEDIIEEYASLESLSRSALAEADSRDTSPAGNAPPPECLSCAESVLYTIISQQPVTVDDLVEKSGRSVGEIAPALLGLQLRKMIVQLPGKRFARRPHVS
ncbi:MAG TPA: DNA-processing protein DprA [Candidatus Omnitrophota bacterium]|nr:DNA-processing protein DprA [Candidatus Omnitrophota bacterium]HRZ14611.1 DNA-processing protein DprA [Candidatus Omnitrophota bacterium]